METVRATTLRWLVGLAFVQLVDVLGQLGVAESPGGQIRVTKTGGGGMMWGYMITANDDGSIGVSVGATP